MNEMKKMNADFFAFIAQIQQGAESA